MNCRGNGYDYVNFIFTESVVLFHSCSRPIKINPALLLRQMVTVEPPSSQPRHSLAAALQRMMICYGGGNTRLNCRCCRWARLQWWPAPPRAPEPAVCAAAGHWLHSPRSSANKSWRWWPSTAKQFHYVITASGHLLSSVHQRTTKPTFNLRSPFWKWRGRAVNSSPSRVSTRPREFTMGSYSCR